MRHHEATNAAGLLYAAREREGVLHAYQIDARLERFVLWSPVLGSEVWGLPYEGKTTGITQIGDF